jgi:hypothetical protein
MQKVHQSTQASAAEMLIIFKVFAHNPNVLVLGSF